MISIPRTEFSEGLIINEQAPAQLVEKVQETEATTETKKILHPSPMSIFQQREREKAHVAEQTLVSVKPQEANGWYNPFAKFYGWVLKAIYGEGDTPPAEDGSGLTEADYKKIKMLAGEIRMALAALDDLIEQDPEVNEDFDKLLLMIQKNKEAMHKKSIIQQGESLHKASKELKDIRERIKKETEEYLEKLSRNGTLAKIARAVTPFCGALSLLGNFSTNIPQIDLVAKPVVLAMSALAALNLGRDFVSENVADVIDFGLTTAVQSQQGGAATAMILFAQALAKITQSYSQYADNRYKGLMGVEGNNRRMAIEDNNDIGEKAANYATKFFKEVGNLAEMLAANLELIKALWNR